jgi:hypothetical protein
MREIIREGLPSMYIYPSQAVPQPDSWALELQVFSGVALLASAQDLLSDQSDALALTSLGYPLSLHGCNTITTDLDTATLY